MAKILLPKNYLINPKTIIDKDSVTLENVMQNLANMLIEPAELKKKKPKPKNIWEQDPVDPVTFITSPDYLNLADVTRQCVIDDLRNLFPRGDQRRIKRKYNMAVFSEAIGTGKSFKMAIIATYLTYILLCMRDPAATFNLAPRSKIAIMNMSVSADQAKRVVFGEIKNKIDLSPWFQNYYPPNPKVRSELQFDVVPENPTKIIPGKIYKSIYIIPGSSSGMAPLGYNLYAVIIDEATLWRDTQNKDYVEDVYNTVSRRITSRFQDKGLVILGGSPMYNDDFLERKIDEAFKKKEETNVEDTLVVRRSQWDALMPNYDGQVFYFHKKDSLVFENKLKLEKRRQKVYNKALKKSGKEAAEASLIAFDKEIAEIPVLYYQDFKNNPEGSKRDLGGWTSNSINPFFELPNLIEERCDFSRANPVFEDTQEFKSWFQPIARNKWHAIHIDLGVTKDACGIALGHNEGFNEKGNIIHYIDLILRLQGSKEKPIQLEDVRQIIYKLTKLGFMIGIITLDGFESIDMTQILTKRGYYVEYLSVDKNLKPYTELKNAIYEDRCNYYYHQKFIEELQKVEQQGKKIDHPRLGSKDCSDAVAGCVYNLARIADWEDPEIDEEETSNEVVSF